jgi:hypothetical protein
MAAGYLNYGRTARGSGDASTVTDEDWKAYGDSAEPPRKELEEANHLSPKCPYWYAAMLDVALAQGWNKARVRQLVGESFSFEPDFYHMYRRYMLTTCNLSGTELKVTRKSC